MKNVTVLGTGYVGLVTGISLAEIGHKVVCLDLDDTKVEKLSKGIPTIYEPGLDKLLKSNLDKKNITFTSDYATAFNDCDIVFLAVGTPQKSDGTANLNYIESAARSIASHIEKYTVIVTKSTVPVGTNEYIEKVIKSETSVTFDVASNPEFLREGSAIKDTFNTDRIVIGSNSDTAINMLREIYEPFNCPIFITDIRSAEMIKYASNAFLATKISFINEIANLCDKLGANVDDVSLGMGKDHRIGEHFLKAGIGYGGSCFPKDTNALVQIAGNVEHEFVLLKSVIEINNNQQKILVNQALDYFGDLVGKKIALLGLSFKPNTDDMRESASIVIAKELDKLGASITAYDPITISNAKKVLPQSVRYFDKYEDAVDDADAIFILTDWQEIKEIDLEKVKKLAPNVAVFDGRNIFNPIIMEELGMYYYSIGRPHNKKSVITNN